MKYEVQFTRTFKRAQKRLNARDWQRVEEVIEQLANGKALPAQNRDHALKGNKKGLRECHIRGDLLLIYKIQNNILLLTLIDIGTHSQTLNC